MINKDICITFVKNKGEKIDIGITAPKSVIVHRLEIFEKNKIKEKKEKHESKF